MRPPPFQAEELKSVDVLLPCHDACNRGERLVLFTFVFEGVWKDSHLNAATFVVLHQYRASNGQSAIRWRSDDCGGRFERRFNCLVRIFGADVRMSHDERSPSQACELVRRCHLLR